MKTPSGSRLLLLALLPAALALFLLLAPALHAQDALLQPTAISSSTSATDLRPAGQLIDGSGLSGTPTLAALGTHTTSPTTAWVTEGVSFPQDYFASKPPPVLTCTLPQVSLVSELIIWGYGGGHNEAKSFSVAFSTDGMNYGSTVAVGTSILLANGAARLVFPGGPRMATHVRVTVTDNYWVSPGTSGGDRVVLGEIRFAGQLGVIVRNLANSSTAQVLSEDGPFAQAFQTGSAPIALKAITVRLMNLSGTSRARVQLWSSPPAGTLPVTLVEDLGPTVDFTSPTDTDYTVSSTMRPVLAANSRYWVVVFSDSGAGAFRWRNTSNPAFVSASGATLPLARAKGTGTGPTWEIFPGSNYQLLSVTGGLIVTTTNDSGAGSLRQALADAAAVPGADVITFAPGLSGQVISLNGVADVAGASALIVDDSGGVTVDASALPGGITLTASGPGYRAFRVASGSSVTLRGLTVSGFTGESGFGGGAIRNAGTLALERCTLSGNSASADGGAIFTGGTLTLTHCTLSGNYSEGGGGISNFSTLTLTHCTLSGNSSSDTGGAIENQSGTLTLTNTIIAGNTAPAGADIFNRLNGILTRVGVNTVPAVEGNGAIDGTGTISTADPRLAPLASHGGGTQTLLPLPGSPAIDAVPAGSIVAGLATDQRGFARNVDADGVAGALPDIGAVEVRRTLVTTAADELDPTSANGTGVSLREALRDDAAGDTADHIIFSPAVFTGGAANVITLDSAKGEIAFTATVAISGASVGGLTVDGGPGANRLFSIGANRDVHLHRLTLTGGGGTGAENSGDGGAVRNVGTLTLEECTVTGNTAGHDGGGVWSPGPLTLTRCTISANTASNEGGAVRQQFTAFTATHCTFGGNSASLLGGGVSTADGGAASFTHCTFSQNAAPGVSLEGQPAGGGGLFAYAKAITLTNCVLAGNTTADSGGADLNLYHSPLTRAGANLVPLTKFVDVRESGAAFLTGAAQLTALANWGGTTRTFYPQAGSAALEVATVVAGLATDQRGAALPGSGRDLGAVEAGAGVPGVALTVTAAADEFNGLDAGGASLREIVTLAPASTIGFNLAGGTVVNVDASLAVAGRTLATGGAGGAVDVAVNAGTLTFGAGSVWAGGGQILLGATSGSAAATVEVNGPNGFTLAAPITVRGGSSGVKTLRGANVGDNFFNDFGGVITLLADATVEKTADTSAGVVFTGDVNVGAQELTVNANSLVVFGGRVFRGDGTGTARLVKNGAAGLNLFGSGDNTRLAVTVNAGVLNLGKLSTSGVHVLGGGLTAVDGPALTVANGVTTNVGNFGSGTDQIADTASVTVHGTLDLSRSETVSALNGGASGMVQSFSGNTLTVGAGNGSGTFTGSLSGFLSLTKTGTGTQTVAGGNMSGALLVSGGTLEVTGTLNDISGATVNANATFAGYGSVSRLTLQSGSFVAPRGIAGNIGTADTGVTTWNGGATARFHLSGTDGTSDLVVTGLLDKTGSGLYAFDFQGTGRASQPYTLATFPPGGTDFVASDFTATNLAPGLRGFFTLNGPSLQFTTYASTAVTSTADSGAGSLRQAVLNAASTPGADTITFPAALGGPIVLDSEIVLGSPVTLDASNLPGGVTISGNQATRLFTVSGGQSVALTALTLTGGRTTAAGPTGIGGAISNVGTLTLTRCTLSDNTAAAAEGGAIGNIATLTLDRCTLTGNTVAATGAGGAIHNSAGATLHLVHSTVSANTGGNGAGGLYAAGTVNLANSIVAGNIAPIGADIRGPGNLNYRGTNIVQSVAGALTITGSPTNAAPLLAPLGSYGGPTRTMALQPGSPARNAAGVLSEMQQVSLSGNTTGTFTLTFNGQTTTSIAFAAAAATVQDALELLGTIGPGNVSVSRTGNVFTVTFVGTLAGANQPVLTAAVAGGTVATVATPFDWFLATADQRGFPIVGMRDISAYEAGTFTDFDAWSWEMLPASATPAQHAATFDFDGDGRTLLLEYAGQFSPTVPEAGSPLGFTTDAARTLATIVMPYRYDAPDLFYTIERSTNLTGTWTSVAYVDSATNDAGGYVDGITFVGNTATTITFTDDFIAGQPQVFYRLKVEQQ